MLEIAGGILLAILGMYALAFVAGLVLGAKDISRRVGDEINRQQEIQNQEDDDAA